MVRVGAPTGNRRDCDVRLVAASRYQRAAAQADEVGRYQGQDAVTLNRFSVQIKQAINVSGIGNFDLVTLKGTLEVENRKPDPVKMKIKKEITGEVISTEGSPKITKTAKGLRQMNPRSVLEWTLEIPSGKHASVSYTYKVYIRY